MEENGLSDGFVHKSRFFQYLGPFVSSWAKPIFLGAKRANLLLGQEHESRKVRRGASLLPTGYLLPITGSILFAFPPIRLYDAIMDRHAISLHETEEGQGWCRVVGGSRQALSAQMDLI